MLEVILDTETTGLSTASNHKIVEIGCVELNNQIPTNKIFHTYLNPQRSVSEDALKVHGYSENFLSSKKVFSEIAEEFPAVTVPETGLKTGFKAARSSIFAS